MRLDDTPLLLSQDVAFHLKVFTSMAVILLAIVVWCALPPPPLCVEDGRDRTTVLCCRFINEFGAQLRSGGNVGNTKRD